MQCDRFKSLQLCEVEESKNRVLESYPPHINHIYIIFNSNNSMPGISDIIGERFEEMLQEHFPDFERTSENPFQPDFLVNGKFLVEAKTGFFEYGVQPKVYQVEAFQNHQLPVIYALGYHNFERVLKRLSHLTHRKRVNLLRKEMGIVSLYFISDNILRNIWHREEKVPESNPNWHYCDLRARFLEGIVNNAKIRRSGIEYRAREWFGVKARDFILRSPENGVFDFPVGTLLHKRIDLDAIKYLKETGCLK